MIKLKLNVDLLNNKKDSILSLETDIDGNIINSFWARRLKDSEVDNCVEIIQENKKPTQEKKVK